MDYKKKYLKYKNLKYLNTKKMLTGGQNQWIYGGEEENRCNKKYDCRTSF